MPESEDIDIRIRAVNTFSPTMRNHQWEMWSMEIEQAVQDLAVTADTLNPKLALAQGIEAIVYRIRIMRNQGRF